MIWLAAAFAAPNLVVISMDTTRADALSCYFQPVGPHVVETTTTPVLDQLAADGTRFERFWAHAPTTLSSHTSMLAGLDPHEHAVPRNGYMLSPDIVTLPQILQAKGYDTIGVIGSAALESKMGLDRGFRVYDDDTPELKGIMYQDRAAPVVDRTLAAIDARPDAEAPLFAFVHFYDPHTPYDPPAEIVERFTDPAYDGGVHGLGGTFKRFVREVRSLTASTTDMEHVAGLYLGEVHYVDQQIGRLLDQLESRGLLEEAVVVVTADHGETLGESNFWAYSHGSTVNWEVSRVPLIVKGYGVPLPRGRVVEQQVPMSQLAATLQQAVGFDPTLGSGDFWHLLRPGPVRLARGWPETPTAPVFAEATRPRQVEPAEGWNNSVFQRQAREGGFGMTTTPFINWVPTISYDSLGTHDGVLQLLDESLARWDAAAPPHAEQQQAPSTQRALKALGYID